MVVEMAFALMRFRISSPSWLPIRNEAGRLAIRMPRFSLSFQAGYAKPLPCSLEPVCHDDMQSHILNLFGEFN